MPSKGVECTERLFFSPSSDNFLRTVGRRQRAYSCKQFLFMKVQANGYFNNGPDLYNSKSRSFMYNTHFTSTPDNPLDKASRPKAVQDAT